MWLQTKAHQSLSSHHNHLRIGRRLHSCEAIPVDKKIHNRTKEKSIENEATPKRFKRSLRKRNALF